MSGDSNFSQKEVLLLVQKSLHEKKVIFLPTANWSGLDLRGTILKNSNLKFANLSGCNLQSADLENCNLRNADLTGADLTNAKLVSSELTDAKCDGAKFDGAVGLGERFKAKWNIVVSEEQEKNKKNKL